MRVLLTGTAGFIGSRVAEMLLDQGHSVRGIDNLCPAYDVRLKDYRLSRLTGRPGFDFAPVDVADRAGLSAFWKQSGPFDAVVHLAARAGSPPERRGSLGIRGHERRRNSEPSRAMPPRRCRQARSCLHIELVRGSNPVPFAEDANTDRPLSPYAASKKGAETLCWTYHHLYGLDVTVFRYFTVYGPAGRPDMSLFRFVQWIYEDRPLRLYGDGTQSRDFTYVDDIARGTIQGIKPVGYEIINLGSNHPHDLLELIKLIEQRWGGALASNAIRCTQRMSWPRGRMSRRPSACWDGGPK